MVCAIVRGKSYRPGLTFDDAELAAIRQPTLHVHGTSDVTVGPARAGSASRTRCPAESCASSTAQATCPGSTTRRGWPRSSADSWPDERQGELVLDVAVGTEP